MISAKAFQIAESVAFFLNAHYEDSDNSYSDRSDYRDAASQLRDDVKAGRLKFGFKKALKASSGCYRTAIIFPGFIVKFSRDRHRQSDIVSEYEFIKNARRKRNISRHFPETYVVTVDNVSVQVQEKVDMTHRGRNTFSASRLGEALGLSDMHDGNFGWKGRKGKEYPVFVDVDFRCGEGDGHRPSPNRT